MVSGGARQRADTPVGTLLVCSLRGEGSHWEALVHIRIATLTSLHVVASS